MGQRFHKKIASQKQCACVFACVEKTLQNMLAEHSPGWLVVDSDLTSRSTGGQTAH